MTMVFNLFRDVRNAQSARVRVRAVCTLMMWFCGGAYVTSVATGFFTPGPNAIFPEFLGGAVAVFVAGYIKIG
jgi:hypothetical protein